MSRISEWEKAKERQREKDNKTYERRKFDEEQRKQKYLNELENKNKDFLEKQKKTE